MPTNEERREVAAELREHKATTCVVSVLGWQLQCEKFDCCENCAKYNLNRLADLIEPQERTCRRVEGAPFPKCSECGAAMGFAFKFCAMCGHKVVS